MVIKHPLRSGSQSTEDDMVEDKDTKSESSFVDLKHEDVEAESSRCDTPTATMTEYDTSDDVALSLHAFAERDGIIAKISPPKQPEKPTVHVPCDIVLVIDVSGSMGANAPIPANPGEVAENYGLSVLDLVRHAALTIVETLDEGDRLGIVTFASQVKVVQELIPMNKKNKVLTKKNIKKMVPTDATNLWQGLLEAIKLFSRGSGVKTGRVPAMMVLTDGQPNLMCPAQGYVPKMREEVKRLKDGRLPASIHTFGFGYNLRSGLLKSIAEEGGGNYAFIPDSGMIGTVFVHAVANLQATYAINATLCLTYSPLLSIEEAMGESVNKQEVEILEGDVKKGLPDRHELSISLGNLQYGQSRDIYLRVDAPAKLTSENAVVKASIQYSRMASSIHGQSTSQSLLVPTTLPESELAYHLSRSKICSFLSTIIPIAPDGEHKALFRISPEKIKELKALIKDLPAKGFPSDPNNKSLVEDLEGAQPKGQVSLALTNEEYYKKWGVHYIPSYLNAHTRQICNTFKDPGPLRYGDDSPLFIACRNRLDHAFDSIPPPKPSNQHTATHRGRVSMSHYNSSSGVCFIASTPVRLASSRIVPIKALRRGVAVQTPSGPRRVVAILKTPVEREIMCRVGELVVTPWHPLSLDGGKTWTFPANIADQPVRYTGCIYSVLLQPNRDSKAHAINVAGKWGVTLGHGIVTGQDSRAHQFFGNYRKVVRSLRRIGVSKKGVAMGGGVSRDSATGLVSGFALHTKRNVSLNGVVNNAIHMI
ncbi:von Willebrand factor type A domain-containing protein [Colletotrichum godetiae]|uniref:von Willebrand factor type A domain-containing protein n=1 Tax=Colletotrichum godetiae TaxID=1209918 RepID=A0AAJ0AE38_9PEZI|nr:von Willebrand factor type A domain-containing protein [Colletotrichum godetiae]KAK1671615.1 von Willebrand factor type A domain-containing protein [Colletotrichum godetiae]